MNYEDEVIELLGKENHDLCLKFCDEEKLFIEAVEQIAQCLDKRIFGAFKRDRDRKRDQQKTRDCLRFVFDHWYNFAHEGGEVESQFNVFKLIEMLKDQNVQQFVLASELEKLSKVSTSDREPERSKDKESDMINNGTDMDQSMGSGNFMYEVFSPAPAGNQTLPMMHKISQCSSMTLPDHTYSELPVYGRRIPLNEILIELVTYQVREKEFDGVFSQALLPK